MSKKNDFTMTVSSSDEFSSTTATVGNKEIATVTGSNSFIVNSKEGGSSFECIVTAGQLMTDGSETKMNNEVVQGDPATVVGQVNVTSPSPYTFSASVSLDAEGAETVTLSWQMSEGWEGAPLTGTGYIVSGHGGPQLEAGGYE